MCGPLRLSGFDAQAVWLCDVDTRVVHCSGLQQSPLTSNLHLAGNHTALTGATYDIDGGCDD
jgi:hypothetical protein